MTTPNYSNSFEANFANLEDPSVAAEALIVLTAPIQNNRDNLPLELSKDKDVRAILDAGLPEVHNKFIGLDVINKMTTDRFSPLNGINALLTPPRDLGNGISARQHAVSGAVFLFPSGIPSRIFIKSYDEMPQVGEMTEVQEGGDTFNRIKVSGTRGGQNVDEELIVPALAA